MCRSIDPRPGSRTGISSAELQEFGVRENRAKISGHDHPEVRALDRLRDVEVEADGERLAAADDVAGRARCVQEVNAREVAFTGAGATFRLGQVNGSSVDGIDFLEIAQR